MLLSLVCFFFVEINFSIIFYLKTFVFCFFFILICCFFLFHKCFGWDFILLVQFGKCISSPFKIPICFFQAPKQSKTKNVINFRWKFHFIKKKGCSLCNRANQQMNQIRLTFYSIPNSFDYAVTLLGSFVI